jgi:hypothetical protein
MEEVLLLNGMANIALAALCGFMVLFFLERGKGVRTISSLLGACGVGYFLLGFLQLVWFSGKLPESEKDFIFMFLVTTTITSMVFVFVSYKLSRNRNLVFLFLLFLVSILAADLAREFFVPIALGISLLLLLISFSEFLFFRNRFLRRAGLMGMSSTLIMIAFSLLMVNFDANSIPWFITTMLLFSAVFLLFKDMQKEGPIEEHPQQHHVATHAASILLKFLIFITSLSAFIFLSVVSLHEFGHAIVGQYYGCEQYKAVIYDVSHQPRTEFSCDDPYNNFFLSIAGFAITILLGLLFLMVGDAFTYRLSTLILGYALLISYGDFLDLGLSPGLALVLTLLSVIVIIFSVIRLSSYYLSHYHYFGDDMDENIKNLASGRAYVRKIALYEERP